MGGYIVHFTVYTMAMVGLIFFAVYVYKKIANGSLCSKNAKFLSIEDSMSLSPRKSIHVIRAGNEKFLIASDVDRTTLLAKLEWKKAPNDINNSDRFRELPPAETILDDIKQETTDTERKIGGIDINPKQNTNSEKVIHLEQVDPTRKRVGARPKLDRKVAQPEVKVQQRRRMPQPEPQSTYRIEPPKRSFSPMKEMAKRINEL